MGTIALLLLSSIVTPNTIHAEKSLKEIQKERKEIKQDVTKAEKEVAALLKEINVTKKEIEEYNKTLEANEKAINEVTEEMNAVEEEIAYLEQKIEERFDILKERAKSYQSNGGNIGILEVIFGAKDFNEFISRLSAVTTITDSDAQLIEEQEKDKAEVEKKLAQLDDLKVELEQIRENTEAQKELTVHKKEELETKQGKLNALVKKLKLEDKELAALEAEFFPSDSGGGAFSEATANSSGVLGWPTSGGYISSHVGQRWGRTHKGIDIARTDRSTNPPIFAAADGTVESASFNGGGYGNMVIINHGNGMKTLYAHMSSLTVKSGQKIGRGQQIGVMGSTGNSTGVHLHFEVHVNGSIQNPVAYLK